MISLMMVRMNINYDSKIICIFNLLHAYDTFASLRSVGGDFILISPERLPECVFVGL